MAVIVCGPRNHDYNNVNWIEMTRDTLQCRIWFNGFEISSSDKGWFVGCLASWTYWLVCWIVDWLRCGSLLGWLDDYDYLNG
jgi:hypothetical protein